MGIASRNTQSHVQTLKVEDVGESKHSTFETSLGADKDYIEAGNTYVEQRFQRQKCFVVQWA